MLAAERDFSGTGCGVAMKIFYAYILKKFLKAFVFAAFGFLTIFVFSGIVSRIDIFSRYHASFSQILFFILLKIPDWLLRVIPVALLIAEVVTIAELRKHNEIVAARSGGVSIMKIMKPFVWFAIAMSVFMGVFEDRVVLRSTNLAYKYYNETIRGQKPKERKGKFFNLILNKPAPAFYYLGFYDADTGSGLVFYFERRRAGLVEQIIADSFRNRKGKWILFNGAERVFNSDFLVEKADVFKRREYYFSVSPSDFIISRRSFAEMPLGALASHIKKLKAANLPSVSERVEFHSRISQDFSPIIIILIGIPFGFLLPASGRNLAVVLSVVMSFVYWGIFSLGVSFARTQVLSPVIGAWSANVLFAASAVFIFRRKFV